MRAALGGEEAEAAGLAAAHGHVGAVAGGHDDPGNLARGVGQVDAVLGQQLQAAVAAVGGEDDGLDDGGHDEAPAVPHARLHGDGGLELPVDEHEVRRVGRHVGVLDPGVVVPVHQGDLRGVVHHGQVYVLQHHDHLGHGGDLVRQVPRRVLHDQRARGAHPRLQRRGAMEVRVVPVGARHVVVLDDISVGVRLLWANVLKDVVARRHSGDVRTVQVDVGAVGTAERVVREVGVGLRAQVVRQREGEAVAGAHADGRPRRVAVQRRDVGGQRGADVSGGREDEVRVHLGYGIAGCLDHHGRSQWLARGAELQHLQLSSRVSRAG
mmetsp:Transcript_13342/g.34253  ORF Transcript_13342/g.34253 Transcript_13342/m.34253 type:complete len:324 (+) Transcript_13342:1121-2092(+)